MNYGTYAGPGTGVPYGSISRFIQTPTIATSQTIAVPPGTQRIEALLVGGGGSGGASYGGGGGFGGAAIIQVPITGQPLQVVVGAGGTSVTGSNVGVAGSPTYIVSANVRYAEVGGGGGGGGGTGITAAPTSGRSGGGGGGGNYNDQYGANGGSAPIGNVLWSCYPQDSNRTQRAVYTRYIATDNSTYYYASPMIQPYAPATAGQGGGVQYSIVDGAWAMFPGQNGSFGGGGGGGAGSQVGTAGAGGNGGGGGGGYISAAGTLGGGGGSSAASSGGAGGSLTSVSVWGYTGFANGSTTGAGGGGGGGLLAAGAAGASTGGAGGNGGGGGGGSVPSQASGAGGNGFAVLRFYL
jgi:hypothetical protein